MIVKTIKKNEGCYKVCTCFYYVYNYVGGGLIKEGSQAETFCCYMFMHITGELFIIRIANHEENT